MTMKFGGRFVCDCGAAASMPHIAAATERLAAARYEMRLMTKPWKTVENEGNWSAPIIRRDTTAAVDTERGNT
jgi:hypothetical protein